MASPGQPVASLLLLLLLLATRGGGARLEGSGALAGDVLGSDANATEAQNTTSATTVGTRLPDSTTSAADGGTAGSTSAGSVTTALPDMSNGATTASSASNEATTTGLLNLAGGATAVSSADNASAVTSATNEGGDELSVKGSTGLTAEPGSLLNNLTETSTEASTMGTKSATAAVTEASTASQPASGVTTAAEQTSGAATSGTSAAGTDQSSAGSSESTSSAGAAASSSGSTPETSASSAAETASSSSSGTTSATAASETAVTNARAPGNNTAAAETGPTDSETNVTTTRETTTTEPTTTLPPPKATVVMWAVVRIISWEWFAQLGVGITQAFTGKSRQVETELQSFLPSRMKYVLLVVKVVRFSQGSVRAHLEMEVETNETSVADVDVDQVKADSTQALKELNEHEDMVFDPESAEVTGTEVKEPVASPSGPTVNPYLYTFVMFTMRAPNENYTLEMNDTESQTFKDMDRDVDEGVKAMLAKKYPPPDWEVKTEMQEIWNDTKKGLWIRFKISVSPQYENTTRIVTDLGKKYVFFSRLGKLQIDPSSVYFKDLTNYAPGLGVVIMDEDYLRKMRQRQYNGSYVGDYTTARPTLRPIVKRHHKYIMEIALPAFLGMMAFLGLLLICTSIAGSKKEE